MASILEIMHHAVTSGVGDWSSLIGLMVALVGFLFTIILSTKAKNAAEKAKTAADNTRKDIRRFDSVAELSAVIAKMEEIKLLQRKAVWENLPHQYSLIRKALITVRTANCSLKPNQQAVLQSAITMVSSMEQRIERALLSPPIDINVGLVNTNVSREMDGLQALSVEIKENK